MMGTMSELDIAFTNLLRSVAFGDNAWCIYCEFEPLEPDYDRCPECKKENPIREMGMI